jgi:homoserine dehydrogenase
MTEAGTDFQTALSEAQAKGYAERNPSTDIDGIDAAGKSPFWRALS